MRLQWFKQCLAEIEKVIRDTDVVAFPYNIGCGLAGGDWAQYFAQRINAKVVVYKLN